MSKILIDLYERALKASWPDGAKGEAFDLWNEARILQQEPAADCGLEVERDDSSFWTWLDTTYGKKKVDIWMSIGRYKSIVAMAHEAYLLGMSYADARDAMRLERIAELEAQYQRDVYGLNNEGDPIGGDPAGGYANDNARLRAELGALKGQAKGLVEALETIALESTDEQARCCAHHYLAAYRAAQEGK